jgi:hypothetical protein
MKNLNMHPAVFLDTHYCKAGTPYCTVERLEKILLDQVYKQCAVYGTEVYYDSGWVQTLLMINDIYISLSKELIELEAYKRSALWIARWLLELLQRRPQLSASNALTQLEELLKDREYILEYLESQLT